MQTKQSLAAVRVNELSNIVIGAAIRVHDELGPGLLESTYEACLAFELVEHGLPIERQKPMPLRYRGVQLDCGYRLDLVVEAKLIVEVKAISALSACTSPK